MSFGIPTRNGLGVGLLASTSLATRRGAAAPFTAVAADGWQATVASPVDLSLSPATVLRAGYDASGNATTITDTVRLTKRVRQPFPNQASFTANSVALDDYIYQGDFIPGAVNNSTAISPKPIATWGRIDRIVVGNSLAWEIIPFHRNARLGRQVPCVRVRATDGTNTTDWQTVSTTVVSTSCEGPNAVEAYAGTLDITGLNDDSLITLEGQVPPWFGVSGSVLNSATETEFRFTNRFFYKNIARAAAPNIICVASTGNDATGVVSTNEATAAATPCLTVGGAIARAAAVLGNATRNVLSGLEVRVIDAVSMGTVGFVFVNQDAAAIKVTRASTATRAAANITMSASLRPYSAGNNRSPQLTESALLFEDVTITRTADVSFMGEAARRMHVQFRNVDFNFSSQAAASGMMSNSNLSFFGLTGTNYVAGFAFGSSGDLRIIRGVNCDLGGAPMSGYNVIGCDIGHGRIDATQAQRGCLIYSNTIDSIPNGAAGVLVATASSGQNITAAVVQNLIVKITTPDSVGFRISGDSNNGNVVHLVLHHNTSAGDEGFGRYNILYDETPATARTHTLASVKGNLGPQFNIKGDVFMSNGARLGHFPFHHGVGMAGNFTEDLQSGGAPALLSFGFAYAGPGTVIGGGDILFVDDRAMTASPLTPGSLGGNYRLQSGSPARDTFAEYLLGFDIEGTARPTSGAVDAGCYA